MPGFEENARSLCGHIEGGMDMNRQKSAWLRRAVSALVAAMLLTVFAACAVAEEETAALPEIPVLEDAGSKLAAEATSNCCISFDIRRRACM